MVTLTRRAAEQIKQSADQSGMQGQALRIAAQRKPDQSIEYAMGFDEAGMTDTRLQFYGVEVLVSATSETLLEDAILDYVELEEYGQDKQFIFLNPNDPSYVPPSDNEESEKSKNMTYDANADNKK